MSNLNTKNHVKSETQPLKTSQSKIQIPLKTVWKSEIEILKLRVETEIQKWTKCQNTNIVQGNKTKPNQSWGCSLTSTWSEKNTDCFAIACRAWESSTKRVDEKNLITVSHFLISCYNIGNINVHQWEKNWIAIRCCVIQHVHCYRCRKPNVNLNTGFWNLINESWCMLEYNYSVKFRPDGIRFNKASTWLQSSHFKGWTHRRRPYLYSRLKSTTTK